MRSRDIAVGSLVLALIFGILPNFVPMYEFDGGPLGSSTEVFVWGVDDGDSETWFDQDAGNDDDQQKQLDLLRAAMIINYIGLGFAALAILGVFFREGVSHFVVMLAGAMLFVSNVLFFYGADFAFGSFAEAGLTFYFLASFFGILATGHAMRRI